MYGTKIVQIICIFLIESPFYDFIFIFVAREPVSIYGRGTTTTTGDFTRTTWTFCTHSQVVGVQSQSCSIVLTGVSFNGTELGIVSAIEFQGCCKACRSTEGCGCFTFHSGSGNCTLYPLESTSLEPVNSSFVSGILSTNNHLFSVVWVATIIMGITLIFWIGTVILPPIW